MESKVALLMIVLLLPTVSALGLVVTNQLNQTVSLIRGPYPTLATFQIEGENFTPRDATVFVYSDQPYIVTVDNAAEYIHDMIVIPGLQNVSVELRGVNVGNATVHYGYITDVRVPQVFNGMPKGNLSLGIISVNLSVESSVNATCRYSLAPFILYEKMTNNFSDNGTLHNVTVFGLRDNANFVYYVKCAAPLLDSQVNQSTFSANVSCSSDTFPNSYCLDGVQSINNDISFNYTQADYSDYLINFTIGTVYVPPLLSSPLPEPVNITIAVKPINSTPKIIVQPKPKVQLNITNTSNASNVSIQLNDNHSANVSLPVIYNASKNSTNTTYIVISYSVPRKLVAQVIVGELLFIIVLVGVIVYILPKSEVL